MPSYQPLPAVIITSAPELFDVETGVRTAEWLPWVSRRSGLRFRKVALPPGWAAATRQVNKYRAALHPVVSVKRFDTVWEARPRKFEMLPYQPPLMEVT
jgi:hypothetical protein